MLQQLLKLSFEGLRVAFGLRDVLTYSIFIIRSFTEVLGYEDGGEPWWISMKTDSHPNVTIPLLPDFGGVTGIPIGKNKLESDSPREYDDEFLKAFKEQFHGKKNWTCQDAVDREKFEMSKGRIGLVEVIEDDDNKDENEKDTEKRKMREVSQL
ncbi:hypothetical protein Tco_0795317 [Tanacetum coccineum]